MEGMLPWNGDQDNMIDRFDGRALLDFYRDPVPSKQRKTADEEMLDEVPPPSMRFRKFGGGGGKAHKSIPDRAFRFAVEDLSP